jgi:hypothetical protein
MKIVATLNDKNIVGLLEWSREKHLNNLIFHNQFAFESFLAFIYAWTTRILFLIAYFAFLVF